MSDVHSAYDCSGSFLGYLCKLYNTSIIMVRYYSALYLAERKHAGVKLYNNNP